MLRAEPKGQAVAASDSSSASSARHAKPAGKKTRSITFVDYSPAVDASDKKRRRTDVRKHAATASAAARKATIAKRAAVRLEQANLYRFRPSVWYDANQQPVVVWQDPHSSSRPAWTPPPPPPPARPITPPSSRHNSFSQLVEYVTELQGDHTWYLGPVERTSLAHKAMRSNLVDAMTNSTTLFQAALFIAGTHSNTCGLPAHAMHLSTGLILLRGASLEAIHASIVASTSSESLIPVAIAMLAGWERRFGDQQAFEVHMQAWRSLALPAKALTENHVSTLTDLVLESFRENLDERAESTISSFRFRTASTATNNTNSSSSSSPSHHTSTSTSPPAPDPLSHLSSLPVLLPHGFHIFHTGRPEARSLLDIAGQMLWLDPHSPQSIPRLRRLGLENMAWSPTHGFSVEPAPQLETAWDQTELNALYHLRAALIAVGGLLLQRAMAVHCVPWPWDVRAALGVHTTSCQHLRTEELMATHYRGAALWTRFLLCAVFRDPARDGVLRKWLREDMGIESWSQLRKVMGAFWLDEELIGRQCRELLAVLLGGREEEVGERRLVVR